MSRPKKSAPTTATHPTRTASTLTIGRAYHGAGRLHARDAALDEAGDGCDTRTVREVVELLVSFAVTTGALFAVVLRDERRLSPEARERSWPATSRDAALVVFGVLALPVYFARTRRSVLGFALGVLLALGVAAVNALVLGTVEWFFNPD